MKKNMLLLFVLTLLIGGITSVKAKSLIMGIDLKSDFNSIKYTNSYTKTTDSSQVLSVNSTTGNRYVLMSLFNENNNAVSPAWKSMNTNMVHEFIHSTEKLPTSTGGYKYKMGTKLANPWFQTQITGIWTIDK